MGERDDPQDDALCPRRRGHGNPGSEQRRRQKNGEHAGRVGDWELRPGRGEMRIGQGRIAERSAIYIEAPVEERPRGEAVVNVIGVDVDEIRCPTRQAKDDPETRKERERGREREGTVSAAPMVARDPRHQRPGSSSARRSGLQDGHLCRQRPRVTLSGGHMIHDEAPEKYFETVRAFIDDH
jgi:hypothetical protein